jgi:hypothetical protein
MSQEIINSILQQSNPQESINSQEPVNIDDLIKRSDQIEKKSEDTDNIFDKISDIFTGTKRTEFASLPEIGEYKGEGAGATAVGLLLTPNQESQADIIKTQIPGSAIREDKYGNPIVNLPDGRNFYLNKPGASFQDVLQTTAQILSYIPGYNAIAKRAAGSYFKKVIGQAAASGAMSAAQDLGAYGLGAEQKLDIPKLIVATAAPAVFEGAIMPAAGSIINVFKRLSKNKKYVRTNSDGSVSMTDAGKEALKDAGVDPNAVGDDFINKFFQRYTSGLSDDLAKARQEAEFGIDLAASQTGLPKDKVSLADLYEATKGTFGEKAQKGAIDFLENQKIQIQLGFRELGDKFNKGQIGVEDLEGAGAKILDLVRKNFTKAEDNVQTAYNAVNKQALYTGGGSNIQLLTNSARKGVIDSVGVIEPRTMPLTVSALKSLDDLAGQVGRSGQKKVDDVVFDTFEKRRQYLNDLINQAKKEGGPDYRALVNIKKSYDKFLSDSVDNALFAGGDDVVKAVQKARKSVVERERLFGINPISKKGFTIKDKAGEVLHKIINDPDVTPFEVINYAIGSKKLGVGGIPIKVVKRLKKIMGVSDIEKSLSNSDFVSLRTAALERVFSNSIKNDKFLPATLVREFDEVFKNNKSFMDELFTGKEQKQLRDYIEVVRKTLQPTDIANLSNTGSVLSRAIQQAGRGVVGAAALKTGGINFLLATRNAFDRATELFVQRKGRDKVLQQIGDKASDVIRDIRKGFQDPSKTLKEFKEFLPAVPVTPTITGASQQILGQGREVGAPQIEPYEMPQQGSAMPVLDRNMFASLFPGDTLGAAIQERKR